MPGGFDQGPRPRPCRSARARPRLLDGSARSCPRAARIRSGTAAPASGPMRPEAHDDFRPHALLSLAQQPAQPLDRGLADGRQGQGRAVILVRLLLPPVLRSRCARCGRARARPGPRRAQRGHGVEDGQAHLTVLLLHQQIDQHGQRVPLHAPFGQPDPGRRRPAGFHVLDPQALDQRSGALRVRPVRRLRAVTARRRRRPLPHSRGCEGKVHLHSRHDRGCRLRPGVSCSCEQARQRLGAVAEAVDRDARLLQHGQQQVGHRRLRPALQVLARPQGAPALARAR